MKEFKALTISQLELLETKVRQIDDVLNQATALQRNNMERIERMKVELWQLSRDGKGFEREKPIKKTTVKGNKNKK